MKIVIFLFLAIALNAKQISWQGDYNKALNIAKKEHKKLLVLIVKKEPLSTKVIKKLNKIDKIENRYIAFLGLFDTNYPIELYYTTQFPTLFLVDSKDETFISKPIYGENILKQLSIVLSQ